MKAKTVHTILGFYSSGEGDPKQAYDAARSANAQSVHLFDSVGRDGDSKFSQFARLRIDGESLIVATSTTHDIERIIKSLESTGSPAIFILHEDLAQPAAPPVHGAGSLFARLNENEIVLDEARRDLAAAARMGRALTASAEWILDNSYLVRTQISEIRRHLPRNFPKSPSGNGYAPVLDLARSLVEETDCNLTQANITGHLEEFQKTTPLTTAALWFFPLFLRMALVEKLAVLASGVNRAQQLREAAYLWANRLASGARINSQEVDRLIKLMETEAIAKQPYFITSLAEQLQDEEGALAPMRAWIQEHFETPLNELVRGEHTQEAAQRVSVANAFGSLRMLSRIDFTEIFETVSLVEKELDADPGGIYPRSDFATRDECRRVVERISRNSNLNEIEVARLAVGLAANATEARAQHVSYFLLTDAVAKLEAEVKSRVPIRIRLVRAIRRNATGVYIGSVTCLTAAFLTLALDLAWEGGAHQRLTLTILAILALFPLSELAQQIVNVLVIALLPPDTLPKLEFLKSGIPPEDATLVVIPMMLAGAGVVRREIEKLEVRYLANREPNLYFALFSDFIDAPHEKAADDGALLDAARAGIQALNARYSGGRFLLFHRPRVWSETEARWIGRERKRGKIEDLNAFLMGEGSQEILMAGRLPAPVRYAITLDADTQLPPGTARRMIETIAHPLNQIDIEGHTRRRGFSIIQPRVSISLPSATSTRFTRIFADTSGTDPYCKSVSDAQQDLFGEGIFHGKAIYDVRAFHETVGGRFPDETLLSHDLIEGSFAGVALASDIELFENLPLDYVSYCKRMHRWIRGDWQIAPWVFSSVPAGNGSKVPNTLSTISRFRIFRRTILRRSFWFR